MVRDHWSNDAMVSMDRCGLVGTAWYRVSKGLVCLYILEKVEIWSGVTDARHTHSQTTEYRATQLLYSIQFKLIHAIKNRIFIMHSRIRILHLMFMFSHPLKPTEDWTFSILYFVSEHRKIISMISCPFQNLPIKESLQSPSSFRSSLVERRQELHPRVV